MEIDMKKTLLLILIIGSALFIFFLFQSDSDTESIHDNSISISPDIQKIPLTNNKIKNVIENKCFETQGNKRLVEAQRLAKNIHFRKNGQVFRVRIFLEDGEQGTYEKLVYYKEDKDGFPRIVPLDDELAIRPTKKTIDTLLEGGEIIYDETETRFEYENDKSFHVTTKDNRIIRIFDENEQTECNQ
jgi:hypothetical protein